WASGLRLYMTLFMAGWFGRLGWIDLPQALQVLESPWVLLVTGLLTGIEFLADKIPGVDSAWDTVQTFIRVPAGAVLGAATFGEMNPALVTVAGLLGGGIAAGAHFTKAGSRALINTSPEPFSNWAASFTEEAAVAGTLLAAFFHPLILFSFLAVFCLLVWWALPKIWRSVRSIFNRLRI
ncbi:MAG: DUF4126 domain-containing protein, partial [Burkholderiaceae bacterium]